ncbi:MAG: translocation/assembly module TamB domain-containing protein [Gammaproteobacteria bacterium]|nr:translocation/assembly module TamB domain-containing protein [Gammaproteobacteria bacterium]
MNIKKIVTNTVVTLALLFVGMTGNFLLYSDAGTQVVFKIIARKTPGLSYEKISGKLLGRLEILKLKYHSDTLDLDIDKLTSQNTFNIFWLKLVMKELTAENVIINAHLLNIKQKKSSHDSFPLPFGIQANTITLKNLQVKHGEDFTLQLPPLVGSANLSAKNLDVLIYKENDESFFIKLNQNKNNMYFDMHTSINKTDCKIHFYGNKKRYALNSEVYDNHQGKLFVNGSGEGNNHNLQIVSDNLHLNDFWHSKWSQIISFNLNAQHHKKDTIIKLDKLQGVVHDQPIEGHGEVILNKRLVSEINLNILSKNSTLQIQQDKNLPERINWKLHVATIDHYFPSAKGELLAIGNVSSINTKPTLDSEFTLNNFVFKQYKITRLLLQATGELKHHDIKIKVNTKDQNGAIHIIGSYASETWKGIINQFELNNNNQRWLLAKKAAVVVNKHSLTLSPFALISSQGHIMLHGTYLVGKSLQGKMEIRNFDLSLINFLFPESLRINGKINVAAAADFKKKARLNVAAQLSPGLLHYQLHDPETFPYTGGKINVLMDGDNLKSNLSILFPDGQVKSTLELPNFKLGATQTHQKIAGNVSFNLNQPRILETLIPTIKNLSGKIMGNYAFSGTLSNPNIAGELNFSQGSFQIPKINLQITNVNIRAKSTNNLILYSGSLTSGKGILNLNGQTKIEQGAFPLELDLQGTNVLICNQPEIKIFATPNMHLALADKTLKLSGNIVIPEANIHPHDFGNTETASDDIVFIQEDGKKVENSSFRMMSSIHLSLGNKIYLNSRGIKGQVRGQMQIEDDPTKATVANGELWLQDGNYSIYGKTLQINDGRLLFTGGPISNPGLNIKATRSLQAKSNSLFASEETIKVGVQVTGTLHEPKINLYSEPAGKSSADILSYLVLGMPLNSLNQSVNKSNTQLLLQAADALNFSGNNKLLNIKDQLKKGLGLAELDIGTQSEIDPRTQETTQHTAFVLGKYLSPKFYVNYSLDLFDHTNTLKVRYLLNKFWTVQSVANTNGSGVDILYSVEK